jgi:hypothetical protein
MFPEPDNAESGSISRAPILTVILTRSGGKVDLGISSASSHVTTRTVWQRSHQINSPNLWNCFAMSLCRKACGRQWSCSSEADAASKPCRKAGPKAKPMTKLQACLDLLGREQGATLDELMAVTGWQAHSVRGFLSGTVKQKLGLSVASIKDDGGVRRYLRDTNREAA